MSKNKMGCCVDKDCTTATCMVLPDGKTCGDCAYLDGCTDFFGAKTGNQFCQFFPRQFAAKE